MYRKIAEWIKAIETYEGELDAYQNHVKDEAEKEVVNRLLNRKELA